MENTMTMSKSYEQKMLERRSELFEQARGDEVLEKRRENIKQFPSRPRPLSGGRFPGTRPLSGRRRRVEGHRQQPRRCDGRCRPAHPSQPRQRAARGAEQERGQRQAGAHRKQRPRAGMVAGRHCPRRSRRWCARARRSNRRGWWRARRRCLPLWAVPAQALKRPILPFSKRRRKSARTSLPLWTATQSMKTSCPA